MEKSLHRHQYAELFDNIPDLQDKNLLDVGSSGMHTLASAYIYRLEELGFEDLADRIGSDPEEYSKRFLSIDREFDWYGDINVREDISVKGDATRLPVPNESY